MAKPRQGASGRATKLRRVDGPRTDGMFNEAHMLEISSVMLYLEDARRRTERAILALREDGAEPHLVEALERTSQELSLSARKLRQGTFFAVPDAQLTL